MRRGRTSPTGPFVSTAIPAAIHPPTRQRVPPPSHPRKKDVHEAATQNANAESKIAVRPNTIARGDVTRASAASQPHRLPHSRHPTAKTSAAVATRNSTDGSRAARSVAPKARMESAEAAKKKIGLSRYGSSFRCGTTKSPLFAISRATSAFRPSSGSMSGDVAAPRKIEASARRKRAAARAASGRSRRGSLEAPESKDMGWIVRMLRLVPFTPEGERLPVHHVSRGASLAPCAREHGAALGHRVKSGRITRGAAVSKASARLFKVPALSTDRPGVGRLAGGVSADRGCLSGASRLRVRPLDFPSEEYKGCHDRAPPLSTFRAGPRRREPRSSSCRACWPLHPWTPARGAARPAEIVPGRSGSKRTGSARTPFARGDAASPSAARVQPEQDAAGGCDGVKDGKWGFHTEYETEPLVAGRSGRSVAVDRVVLYNRCDCCGERNARIMLLLSDDGRTSARPTSTTARSSSGHSDGKPLAVRLGGAAARFVRLQLPGHELLPPRRGRGLRPGGEANIALGRPATQSSVSQWSAGARRRPSDARTLLRRSQGDRARAAAGREPAALGVRCRRRRRGPRRGSVRGSSALPADAGGCAARQLYLEARWAVRQLALRNPLLDFDSILFVKAAPGRSPTCPTSSTAGGRGPAAASSSSRLQGPTAPRPLPDGGHAAREASCGRTSPTTASECSSPTAGTTRTSPDLPNKADKDATARGRLLPRLRDERRRHAAAASSRAAATTTSTPRYLPERRIVFLSTRKGSSSSAAKANTGGHAAQPTCPTATSAAAATTTARCPSSRCTSWTPTAADLRPISAFENFEWTPAVAARRADPLHPLGLHRPLQRALLQPLVHQPRRHQPAARLRQLHGPARRWSSRRGRSRARASSSSRPPAHHSITGGSLVLLRPHARAPRATTRIVRLTPEVPFPETEGWPDATTPTPGRSRRSTSWSAGATASCRRTAGSTDASRTRSNATGIYLYDAFGNLNLLYRDPDDLQRAIPVPLRPRPRPPVCSTTSRLGRAAGGPFPPAGRLPRPGRVCRGAR